MLQVRFVNNPSLTNFERDINVVFKNKNEWMSVNLLFLNYGKTQFMQFLTTNGSLNEINIEYNNKLISHTCNLKFLGIIIDNTLSWKNHTEMIAPKLNQACYAFRRTKPYLYREALKMVYYAFFTQLCFMS
jgi:hypothetical protein